MAISAVPYTRQIKLNYPNKVLSASVTSIVGTEYWPHPNSPTDPWYEGAGITKKFYQWEVTMSVTTQQHGSNLTREPFIYDGIDVTVGDWIGGSSDGKCLRITSIISKTSTTVVCIAEDYLRYNTFKSPNGTGRFGTGSAVIFSLNEEGNPILDPLPSSTSIDFYVLVSSRFAYLNPQTNYVLDEVDHNFEKGNAISVVADGYVRANAATADTMIGVVTETGPGPDFFMILPNNKIYDFDPAIPGNQGDYVYVDEDGALGNIAAASRRPVFLLLKDAVASTIDGSVSGPIIGDGNSITINSIPITFTGTGGSSNVLEIAQAINTESSNHNVVASILTSPSEAVSNASLLFYGLLGGYTPFSSYIDNGSGNTLVTFTTNGSQYANIASPLDMEIDIESANIANLVVNANEITMSLEDINGNAIVITNNTNDTNGVPFAGPNSITGIQLVTNAVNDEQLSLTRSDGGEILIFESSTVFRDATGIVSGHNGRLPLAMNIEQGVRKGGIYVVSDITARNALSPLPGDQAYVTNKGDGEWGLYQWTGDEWVEIGNLDSAATDARTFEETFTIPYAGNVEVAMGNISPGRKVTEVTVEVTEPFDSPNVSILVGFASVGEYNTLFADGDADFTKLGVYQRNPDYYYSKNNTQDRIIVASFLDNGTTGNAIVRVTYV